MQNIISFLSDLQANNNRDWFQENKKTYDQAKKQFELMVQNIINGIAQFDPEIAGAKAKDCVFRIYRDVRFSKDKSPYKTNMGGYIAKGGRKGVYAGYYLHLDPNQSFLAGGMYMPPSDVLKKLRQEIMYNVDDFKAIIQQSTFQKTFGEIEGEKLKRPPKDFPAEFPDIELLKFKSFTVMHSINPADFSESEFVNYAIQTFEELKPFNDFLNKAFD